MRNWKQMLLSLTLSAGLLTATAAPAMAAPQQPAIKVNNQVVEYKAGAPVNNQGTTLVPLRATLEAMDAQLQNAAGDTIYAIVDGKSVTLKSKLTVINGVTYAPIRVLGDAAGYEVSWDTQTRTVVLKTKTTGSGSQSAVSTQGGRGFMWEVESNGNTVYLVGSMHIADDSFYPLSKEFEEAFAESDYLGVEIDISKAADEASQKLVLEMGTYQDGTTLKDHISGETYAKLGEVLKEAGVQANALDQFKPWVAETTLSSLKAATAGYEASAGIDLYFIQKAIERKIPVVELESYESQLGMFNNFSKELQEANLLAAIENYDVIDQSVDMMAEIWKSGNDEQLLQLTNSFAGDAEYYKAMLVDRNIGMADKIDDYLKNGKNEEYFIVVGAAHYLGEHGIIKLLQDKGYTVVRK
ncbi:polysaccharide biosynthesis protein GumN [Paenibacillus sp. FSL R7-0273]|uniref:TraB/GumN family protein n=1 Tax=Paenibacillus sp. FSL R7-0273 TaxID=1536772 RepID=UPI0004F5FEF2|nr:TraB/GumN family protein [Paenibacillus sp. FSL R7-0273]AIQ44886.1 polysaccharide biosynthesis protein GumN [Paenibacillus sp. FSL R7-0273]OMF93260.1 polysaccharide biosynthesis protein GumN [Paenibacillus sp. FSL R7-0273]